MIIILLFTRIFHNVKVLRNIAHGPGNFNDCSTSTKEFNNVQITAYPMRRIHRDTCDFPFQTCLIQPHLLTTWSWPDPDAQANGTLAKFQNGVLDFWSDHLK